jgi:hypothetical protein
LKENFDRFNFALYKEKEMAFRKCIPVLAVLALILGLVPTASAQPNAFQCGVNIAVPNQLRFEGLTELTGDLVITCTGGTPTAVGQNIPLVNISVFIGNTTVTSRIMNTTTGQSEALLMLDEPQPQTVPVFDPTPLPTGVTSNLNPQTLCTSPNGASVCGAVGDGKGGFSGNNVAGFPTFSYYGSTTETVGAVNVPQHANIFQGIVAAGTNQVQWLGIPIDPPGTAFARTIRVTNIRINANALGVTTQTGAPVSAVAFLSAFPSTALPITFNAQQVVGVVLRGLTTSLYAGPTSYPQCVTPWNPSSLSATTTLPPDGSKAATIQFMEGFASSWKVQKSVPSLALSIAGPTPYGFQDIPGANYGTESGFYSLATGGQAVGAIGVADTSTKLKAVFNNIPLGATVWVPNSIGTGIGSWAIQVAAETSATAFPSAVPAPSWTPITQTTSGTVQSGKAVYEVMATQSQAVETWYLPVYVSYAASPGTGSPGLGTTTVNASFAPTAPAFDAAGGRNAQPSTYPIPRFVDTSTAMNAFTVNICATNLLFPFVTNQLGFDTGLAIANTSLDAPVFATTPQTGACTLYSYGTNAPAAVVSPTVNPGTVWTTLASLSMPNFQGYVIARCTFQYAHGFAFVSDVGARNLAMGYLPLIIPDMTSRLPEPNAWAGVNTGEQLDN